MVLSPFTDFKQQNLELQDRSADNDQGSTSIRHINLIAIHYVFSDVYAQEGKHIVSR